jgi:hypothetical protein
MARDIVSRKEWLAPRKALFEKERELTQWRNLSHIFDLSPRDGVVDGSSQLAGLGAKRLERGQRPDELGPITRPILTGNQHGQSNRGTGPHGVSAHLFR